MRIFAPIQDYWHTFRSFDPEDRIVYTAEHTQRGNVPGFEFLSIPNVSVLSVAGDLTFIYEHWERINGKSERKTLVNDEIKPIARRLKKEKDNSLEEFMRFLSVDRSKAILELHEKYGPVFGVTARGYDRREYWVQFNPNLSRWFRGVPIEKWPNPRQVFQNVESFLGRKMENPPVNNQTNKEKIASHGFDEVKSFRG
jgi:hypothetical protein